MARTTSDLSGILLVDKPTGWTSHDVVARTRGLTRQRKIGHTGTLDPMATGLLVLCLGRATRLVEYMTAHDKFYEGEIQLGIATDTDDAGGSIISRGEAPPLDPARLSQLERQFSGRIMQTPPAYSAVKVEGQRAYAVARGGGTVDLAPREVVIHELTLTALGADRLRIEVHCGSGTYVRGLARDIGEALGCGAHLASLRRIAAGGFRVDEAFTLEEVAALAGAGLIQEALLQPDDGVADLDAAIVTTGHAARLSAGLQVHHAGPERPAEQARIYGAEGAFLGIGRVSPDGQIRAIKVLNAAN